MTIPGGKHGDFLTREMTNARRDLGFLDKQNIVLQTTKEKRSTRYVSEDSRTWHRRGENGANRFSDRQLFAFLKVAGQ